MKKRIISLILSLSMVCSMFVALETNVAAASYGVNHQTINDSLCNMMPYAYRAALFSSPKYYITHHNINNVYNVTSLENSFNNSPTTAILNSLKDSSGWEKFSTIVMTTLTTAFKFDGELTQQDLYDTLLISMLLDAAATEANDSESVSQATSFISDIFNISTTVVQSTVPTTMTVLDYIMNWSDPKEFFQTQK